MPSILAAVPVLHDVKPQDKQDDIGHKLYLNMNIIGTTNNTSPFCGQTSKLFRL